MSNLWTSEEKLSLEADVLVIGGGLAGGWAAIAAAQDGASVVLVDKGYFGTSGVTATAGPGHWWVPPDPEKRAAAVQERDQRAFGLADRRWMARIIETTWARLPTLADYYKFSVDHNNVPQYRALRGPEYLRGLRRFAEKLGVRILDQSPALELLLHGDGSVAGAAGVRRQDGGRRWVIRSGGVVLATGGCAFLSRLLGGHTNTGDGYLMAAEAGAELSGMEFSNYHTVAALHSTQTRSASYAFATYFDADGHELDIDMFKDGDRALARALLAGPAYCNWSRMPNDLRALLPRIQPAILLPFVRQGIDPFTDRFPVTLHGEGTVRGTGGLRLVDDDCQTSVRGLFAAGDAATRELIAGATSGGGAQNSAWGLSSGVWSGKAATRLAQRNGRGLGRAVQTLGGAGLRAAGAVSKVDPKEIILGVQTEILPYDKNIFRSGEKLKRSLDVLDGLWGAARYHLQTTGVDAVRARESAALIATARWCYSAALARTESRGMHRRDDAAALDPRLGHRLLVGGLDQVWFKPDGTYSLSAVAS